MRVLLDLNVIVDVLLKRDPWRIEAEEIWNANWNGRLQAMISADSISTLFYVVRKQTDLRRAHLAVKTCLESLEIAPVHRAALEMAADGPGADFEDNLQIASAILAGADAIVTRDPKGFARSSIAAMSPAELLAHLAKIPDS